MSLCRCYRHKLELEALAAENISVPRTFSPIKYLKPGPNSETNDNDENSSILSINIADQPSKYRQNIKYNATGTVRQTAAVKTLTIHNIKAGKSQVRIFASEICTGKKR